MQLAAIERRTTVDLVVDRIVRVIKDQKLAAGSRLPGEHELVEQLQQPTHRLRRYRVRYADRVEHLLVGTTPENRIYWAWPL